MFGVSCNISHFTLNIIRFILQKYVSIEIKTKDYKIFIKPLKVFNNAPKAINLAICLGKLSLI